MTSEFFDAKSTLAQLGKILSKNTLEYINTNLLPVYYYKYGGDLELKSFNMLQSLNNNGNALKYLCFDLEDLEIGASDLLDLLMNLSPSVEKLSFALDIEGRN